MQDPGYQWVPVHDPSAGHGLEVAQQNGQYRMKFRASDDVAITIDVHIRISDNVTGFIITLPAMALRRSPYNHVTKSSGNVWHWNPAQTMSVWDTNFLPPECKTSGVGNVPAAGPAILEMCGR
jgi:hypothetical protein